MTPIVGVLLLKGCAPHTSAPPPLPLADRASEIGVVGSGGLQVRWEDYNDTDPPKELTRESSVGIWYRHRLGTSRWTAGVTTGAGQDHDPWVSQSPTTTGWGGVMLEADLYRSAALNVALRGEVGVLYATASLPVTTDLGGRLWFGIAPQVVATNYYGARTTLPLSMGTEFGAIQLSVRAGPHFIDLDKPGFVAGLSVCAVRPGDSGPPP